MLMSISSISTSYVLTQTGATYNCKQKRQTNNRITYRDLVLAVYCTYLWKPITVKQGLYFEVEHKSITVIVSNTSQTAGAKTKQTR